MTTKTGIIPFNQPFISGCEIEYIQQAISLGNLAGDGYFTHLCEAFLQNLTKSSRVLLTSSCTHALEMAAMLIDIQPGDEVIMSSFNFVSAANAFVLRGAKIVFVDIRPDTLNIDEELIEEAISPKTKAIVAMHYGGVACNMQKIMALAENYGIKVIEDAAHCIDAYYKGQHLGSIGHLGTLSFHATKNIQCGEGGALMINDSSFINRGEILRDKGTNRKQFITGEIDKYTWIDIGSSYLLGELAAAFLYGQLLELKDVTVERKKNWINFMENLTPLIGNFELPTLTSSCEHNAHIFFLKCQNFLIRDNLILFLKKHKITGSFHYLPLHKSIIGRKHGVFLGSDRNTTKISENLVRLPLFHGMDCANFIVQTIGKFYDC